MQIVNDDNILLFGLFLEDNLCYSTLSLAHCQQNNVFVLLSSQILGKLGQWILAHHKKNGVNGITDSEPILNSDFLVLQNFLIAFHPNQLHN